VRVFSLRLSASLSADAQSGARFRRCRQAPQPPDPLHSLAENADPVLSLGPCGGGASGRSPGVLTRLLAHSQEEMCYVQLYLQREIAYDTIYNLGALGLLQFRDVRAFFLCALGSGPVSDTHMPCRWLPT
jgi:hypothetical protein